MTVCIPQHMRALIHHCIKPSQKITYLYATNKTNYFTIAMNKLLLKTIHRDAIHHGKIIYSTKHHVCLDITVGRWRICCCRWWWRRASPRGRGGHGDGGVHGRRRRSSPQQGGVGGLLGAAALGPLLTWSPCWWRWALPLVDGGQGGGKFVAFGGCPKTRVSSLYIDFDILAMGFMPLWSKGSWTPIEPF